MLNNFSRKLIYSKQKEVPFVCFREDLNYLKKNSFNFVTSSHRGIFFLTLSFPGVVVLGHSFIFGYIYHSLAVSISIIVKQLKIFLKGIIQGFFVEFKIVGLGFKIKRSSYENLSLLSFDIGFSHLKKLCFPSSLITFVRVKKRFLIFSRDYLVLNIIIKQIKNLRKHNPYKIRGLKPTNKKLRIKIGKKQVKR